MNTFERRAAAGTSTGRRDGADRYYVIAVRTGSESKYIAGVSRQLDTGKGGILWPRRSLAIRKGGQTVESIASLYPGYLFWRTRELTDDSIMKLRGGPGFLKLLKNNREIVPLDDRDAMLLADLIAPGEVVRKSLVRFDQNNRIRVVDGPLRNLEGCIVKVDRRKSRAKVALSLHGRTILVDLGFDVIKGSGE